MSERDFSIGELAQWMSARTAAFLGLGSRKGALAPGMDADFVVFDPDSEVEIRPSEVLHRHNLTPYSGRKIRGKVLKTYLRGVEIGKLAGDPATGQRLQGKNT